MKYLPRKIWGAIFFISTIFLFMGTPALAQEALNAPIDVGAKPVYLIGKVTKVNDEGTYDLGGQPQPYQNINVKVLFGADRDDAFDFEYQLTGAGADRQRLEAGSLVVVVKTVLSDEETQFYVADALRLHWMLVFVGVFFALALYFAGKRGWKTLLGLAFSFVVIISFILPALTRGFNPILVSLIGSVLILAGSVYLSHGWSWRTHIAVMGTGISLFIAVIMSSLAVHLCRLYGLGSDESLALAQGGVLTLDPGGLLLAGIIIGTLGVLDDVTSAQAATVAELRSANASLTQASLYKRALVVGQEHIIALVNTLALAYVGVSLPLLLLFTQTDFPIWIALNSEIIAEEIIRAVVGSSALVLAVPITTLLAVRIFSTLPAAATESVVERHHHDH